MLTRSDGSALVVAPLVCSLPVNARDALGDFGEQLGQLSRRGLARGRRARSSTSRDGCRVLDCLEPLPRYIVPAGAEFPLVAFW